MGIIQKKYEEYKSLIDDRIKSLCKDLEPKSLYLPISYILDGGGKRIRPILLMFCCEAVGGNSINALNAALAVEILHNFTLVHDDIMDNADSRRGRKTIHNKWDVNVAILSGDNMVGLAYKELLNTSSPRISDIMMEFTNGIIEVCEGQSLDKDYETSENVTIEDYLLMIDKKTSKLLETCAVIGALIGDSGNNLLLALRNYAHNLGIAFQIQDDLLDITGDEKKFGKKIGGDLIEGKKTFLILKALELVNNESDRKKILEIITNKGIKTNNDGIINEIKLIYEKYGVINSTRQEVERYTKKAEEYISFFDNENSIEILKWFSKMLLARSF